MKIDIKKDNTSYILKLSGELDFNELENFKVAVENLFEKDSDFDLIIDFKDTKYLDSLTIGYSIKIHTRCRKYARKLIFINVNEYIMRIFTLTKMDKYFDIRVDGKL
jgi:anti-anti-sigma factor